MPSIIFIDHLNNERIVEAEEGQSVMQVAVNNMVEGIIGECGGSCACGTCHCFIDGKWKSKVPEMSSFEQGTIECAVEATPASRLACQITVTPELDGLVVRLPEEQY